LRLANGDAANVSLINFGLHSGTHVDAPAHFIEGGARVDSLPLDTLLGEVEVVEAGSDIAIIDKSFVTEHCARGSQRIVFKTRNSAFWSEPDKKFHEDYVAIDPEAACWLVDAGVKLVGIDYLSVERFGAVGFQTHLAFLSRGVVIVEGLDLRAVSPGIYELLCLPLRIAGGGGDGAPARVILRTLD
jgi:arylformamidase